MRVLASKTQTKRSDLHERTAERVEGDVSNIQWEKGVEGEGDASDFRQDERSHLDVEVRAEVVAVQPYEEGGVQSGARGVKLAHVLSRVAHQHVLAQFLTTP